MKVVPGDEYKKQQMIDEARQLSIAGPVLWPMLERRREIAIQKIIGQFRNGQNVTFDIAELAVIESIKSEIKSKLESLNLIGG